MILTPHPPADAQGVPTLSTPTLNLSLIFLTCKIKVTVEWSSAFRTSLWNQFYIFILDVRPQASPVTFLWQLAITVKLQNLIA